MDSWEKFKIQFPKIHHFQNGFNKKYATYLIFHCDLKEKKKLSSNCWRLREPVLLRGLGSFAAVKSLFFNFDGKFLNLQIYWRKKSKFVGAPFLGLFCQRGHFCSSLFLHGFTAEMGQISGLHVCWFHLWISRWKSAVSRRHNLQRKQNSQGSTTQVHQGNSISSRAKRCHWDCLQCNHGLGGRYFYDRLVDSIWPSQLFRSILALGGPKRPQY